MTKGRDPKMRIDLPNEHWRDVVGYEGFYEVSDQGRVWSVPRIVIHSDAGNGRVDEPKRVGGRFLKSASLPNKSRRFDAKIVGLWKDSRPRTMRVDTLMWEAFKGAIPEGHSIVPADGNWRNCVLANLVVRPKKPGPMPRRKTGYHAQVQTRD